MICAALLPTGVRPHKRSACQLVFKLSGFNCVEPSYLLSQCKHRSLAPPPNCSELHSAFSSTRIASVHSCASFFLLLLPSPSGALGWHRSPAGTDSLHHNVAPDPCPNTDSDAMSRLGSGWLICECLVGSVRRRRQPSTVPRVRAVCLLLLQLRVTFASRGSLPCK